MDDFENILFEARNNLRERKAKPHQLIRPVTQRECSWLERAYETGEIVYRYYGDTYRCIGKNGSAFCQVIDSVPFFELPDSAVAIVI